VAIGAIIQRFEDQIYKHGLARESRRDRARRGAPTLLDSVEFRAATSTRDVSLWFADGSSFPGTANIRQRRKWFETDCVAVHAKLGP